MSGDESVPPASSSLRSRPGKISFSVDSLLSNTRRNNNSSPGPGSQGSPRDLSSGRQASPIRRDEIEDRTRDCDGDRSEEAEIDTTGTQIDDDDEDLNVLDSDECDSEQTSKNNTVIVPQPIHAALQRFPGPGSTRNWPSPAFPHALAGFAWLPPPPHPHSAPLFYPLGGSNSPNG